MTQFTHILCTWLRIVLQILKIMGKERSKANKLTQPLQTSRSLAISWRGGFCKGKGNNKQITTPVIEAENKILSKKLENKIIGRRLLGYCDMPLSTSVEATNKKKQT